MDQGTSHCPACRRTFRGILEYPRVLILAFERLAIPEALDYSSPSAAAKTLEQRRRDSRPGNTWSQGINRTPDIARACGTPEVRAYLARLGTMPGQEVALPQLLPPFDASSRFRWAYPVGNTGIYLSLAEAAAQPGDHRAAEVQMYCDGPNLGSAGGPTLQPLGAIARLHYQGLLVEGFQFG